MDTAAVNAAIRFGLGRTPGQDPGNDPMGWLRTQLTRPDAAPQGVGFGGASVTDAFTALLLDRQEKRDGDAGPNRARQMFRDETRALTDYAVTTGAPFRERLVWFWTNHFTISTRRGEVAPMAANYVREAIRPYVTGSFGDMLLAVMRHPAMLMYLDNAQSAGPNSVVGSRQNRGLNENLARECLELHTVSPAAGYSQADVTEFARILTGWSIERRENPLGFRFRPGVHEPGEKTLLGRRFPQGEQGGIEALAFLSVHPATHRHLATKLVRHFVADVPPPDAVRRIEGVLRDTRGNLGAASLELIRLPAAWQPLVKIRAPQDYIVAALRAADLPADRRPELQGLVAGLGQPLFGAPFPIGWPDTASEWAGPEALMRRIDWAYGFSKRPELPEPAQFAEAALGPLLSEATAAEIRRAGSRRDGLTLLLASPEMQRR